jgi:hypothetical protein
LKDYSDEFSQMILSVLENRTRNSSNIKIGSKGIDVKNISANLIYQDRKGM